MPVWNLPNKAVIISVDYRDKDDSWKSVIGLDALSPWQALYGRLLPNTTINLLNLVNYKITYRHCECVIGIHLQECIDGAHENAHRGKAVRLSCLSQLLLAVWTSPVTQEDPHGWKAFPVHGLRQVLSAASWPASPSQARSSRRLGGPDWEETDSAADYWARRLHGWLGGAVRADSGRRNCWMNSM